MSNCLKIRPMGGRAIPCSQKDRRTGRDGPAEVANLTVDFRSFAYAPKNGSLINAMLGPLVASFGSRQNLVNSVNYLSTNVKYSSLSGAFQRLLLASHAGFSSKQLQQNKQISLRKTSSIATSFFQYPNIFLGNLMFIGPCIIAIVDE